MPVRGCCIERDMHSFFRGQRPCTAAELSTLLGDRDAGELKRLHLKPVRETGELGLLYAESEKHRSQAYVDPARRKHPMVESKLKPGWKVWRFDLG